MIDHSILHPTMTDQELDYILDAIEEISRDIKRLEKDYEYSGDFNEFYHRSFPAKKAWLNLPIRAKIMVPIVGMGVIITVTPLLPFWKFWIQNRILLFTTIT